MLCGSNFHHFLFFPLPFFVGAPCTPSYLISFAHVAESAWAPAIAAMETVPANFWLMSMQVQPI